MGSKPVLPPGKALSGILDGVGCACMEWESSSSFKHIEDSHACTALEWLVLISRKVRYHSVTKNPAFAEVHQRTTSAVRVAVNVEDDAALREENSLAGRWCPTLPANYCDCGT